MHKGIFNFLRYLSISSSQSIAFRYRKQEGRTAIDGESIYNNSDIIPIRFRPQRALVMRPCYKEESKFWSAAVANSNNNVKVAQVLLALGGTATVDGQEQRDPQRTDLVSAVG